MEGKISEERERDLKRGRECEFDNDIENTICEGLLLGQYETVVDLCVKENRYIDALLIANNFDSNLVGKIQKSYFIIRSIICFVWS